MAKKANFEELFFQTLKDVVGELRGDLNDLRKSIARIEERISNLENVKVRTIDKNQLIRLAVIAVIMFFAIILIALGVDPREILNL